MVTMKIKITALLYCICFCLVMNAQDSQLLKGNLGTHPIVMYITYDLDSAIYIRYFYEHQRRDIELNGTINNKGLITVVCYNNVDERFDSSSEKFELSKVKDGYSGIWISNKRILPVQLQPLIANGIKNPYAGHPGMKPIRSNPLDYVRTAALGFIKDSTTRKRNFFLDWYHEKYSGISLFRLRKKTMDARINKINRELEAMHVIESNAALSCTSPIVESQYDLQIDHLFMNNDLLSINLVSSFYCGGAHPDFGSTGYNFDLHTGTLLELEDILWFGKRARPAANTIAWFNYRDSVFAPKLIAVLKKLYPGKMKTTISEDECDYSNPEVWSIPNWYFTPKGLYLGAYFARYARSCDEPEWSVIPYKILKKYIHPNVKIKFPE